MLNSWNISRLYEIFLQCNGKIGTDTRTITEGMLFFALKGANFDGNCYAIAALEQGAAFAVVDDETLPENDRLFKVPDVLAALQSLAQHHRLQLPTTIIGIAGSNGKTTTKELVTAVLATKYSVIATKGNLNNHIGVPLTLLAITKAHEFAVVEMGANHPGEVETLCAIASPDAAIVTSIGKEHLEGFGSMENIISTECAIYKYVYEKKGQLFVFEDDAILLAQTKDYEGVFYYGTSKTADLIGRIKGVDPTVRFSFETTYSQMLRAPETTTHLIGSYNIGNLLAACAVGRYYSVPYRNIQDALMHYKPTNNRSQWMVIGETNIILDAYNANPASMQEAIKSLDALSGKKRIAILGDMFELGIYEEEEHIALLQLLATTQIAQIILVGSRFERALQSVQLKGKLVTTYANVAALKQAIPPQSLGESWVLLKGSRGVALEKWLN